MSILKHKTTVRKPITEGIYDLPLTNVEEFENEEGGYVQLTFENKDTRITHNIFGSKTKQIELHTQHLGEQVGVFGDGTALEDVLIEGFVYKMYVSYNKFGRNISFDMIRMQQTTVEEAL